MIKKISSLNFSQKSPKKMDPLKKTVRDAKKMVQKEILDNEHINQNKDYSVLIKSYGPEKKHLFKSINKNELDHLWKKVDQWNNLSLEKTEKLTPKETKLLSELCVAIKKNECMIKQGKLIIDTGAEKSNIYNECIKERATIIKVQNLAKENITEAEPEEEEILEDDHRRESFTNDFSQAFSSYHITEELLSEENSSEGTLKVHASSERTPTERKSGVLKKIAHRIQRFQKIKEKAAAKRKLEKRLNQEADLKRRDREELKSELDEKADRIQDESRDFEKEKEELK